MTERPRTASEFGARKRAREVLEEHGITSYPVSPESIAQAFQLGLPIHAVDDFPPRVFGALLKNGSEFQILVSKACPSDGHRRFTLCHELGHFFLDGHLDAVFEAGEYHMSDTSHFRGIRKPWYEIEADIFASELLVPSDFGRSVIKGHAIGVSCVKRLADDFRCSLTCASIRYTELTHDPAAIIVSMNGTVEWAAFSAPMRSHSWSRKLLKGEWAPRSSATWRLARDAHSVRDSVQLADEGLLCEWFENAPVVAVSEDALGLGNYGRVLTVLSCPQLPSAEVHKNVSDRVEAGPANWREAMRPWGWDSYEENDD